MASDNSFLSQDQFLCSICLDVFTEPVSIPCGHNFCRVCITKHWQGKDQRQCPLCKEKVNKGLKLRVNTGFREVVENFKKHCVTAKNNVPAKEGQVPCDFCIGIKFKAFKTCLVCLASYCETHLEPHQRVAALNRHKLIDPVQNLENKICKSHNRILELFCRNDLTEVCALCTVHSTHDTVPLEKAYEETKTQLEQKKVEIKEMIQEREKKVEEIKELTIAMRKDKDEATANSFQVFGTLVVSIERNLAGLLSAIEEKQKATEIQAAVLLKELEMEINGLQKRITKLEKISHMEDHLQLIKSFLSFSSSQQWTKSWSDVSISGQQFAEKIKSAMVKLEEMLTKEMERANREFRACCGKVLVEETHMVKKNVHKVTDLETLPEGIKLDAIRQHYIVDMTFDPCTANDLLLFSEDLKQVQTSHIWWFANQGPQKFNRYAFVLGKKGFSEGKFYYEVEATRKTGWDLGVVRESLRWNKTLIPSPRNGVWIIRLRNNTRCRALDNDPVNLSLIKKPERIGVFVDYEKRLVSFYDVDAGTLIYSFTGCMFDEKIYPFFSPGPSEDGINGAPLVLSPNKNPTTWEKISEFFVLIITVIALVFINQI